MGPEVAGLMYHEVTDDPTTSGFQRPGALPYTLTPAAFTSHLNAIAGGQLQPELVSNLDLNSNNGNGTHRHLLLTFDDGGASAMYVADELGRRGWKGHFFIITSRIGERTFLKPSDIRTLRSAGHVVGTHSHTHPDIFRRLPRELMTTEWRCWASPASPAPSLEATSRMWCWNQPATPGSVICSRRSRC